MTTRISSRRYCFTLNNYTDDDVASIREKRPDWVRYLVFGYEVGAEGTPHLQGYMELTKPQRPTAFKSWLKRAHLIVATGTRDGGRDYCMKGLLSHEGWSSVGKAHPDFGLNAIVEEFGEWESGGAGARNDISAFRNRLYEGASLEEVAGEMPGVFARSQRACQQFAMWAERKRAREMGFRHVRVHVVWGAAGVGKSRAVNNIPGYKCMATLSSRDFPLQNYDGESAIWLDDFYGQIPWSEFFRMTDGQPYVINVKGGSRHALYEDVYITSNRDPLTWYAGIDRPYEKAAFLRRLSSVTHVGVDGTLEDCMKAVTSRADDIFPDVQIGNKVNNLVTEINYENEAILDVDSLLSIVSSSDVTGNEVSSNSAPLPSVPSGGLVLDTTACGLNVTERIQKIEDEICSLCDECINMDDNIADTDDELYQFYCAKMLTSYSVNVH